MAIIPKPQFPNVPNLPGVPQLLRSPTFPAAPPAIVGTAIALGRLWQAFTGMPKWGVYKHQEAQSTETATEQESGGYILKPTTVVAKRVAVVTPDSFLSFGYRNEYSVSDYPIQDGKFASFNKVANPFEAFVRMAKGGSEESRKAFLAQIAAIIKSLDLYDIVTPEYTYLSVNPNRFELHREGNKGAYYFAEVDLYFREIRSVSSAYTSSAAITKNAKNSSAKPKTNVGVVNGQTSALTPAQENIPTGAV